MESDMMAKSFFSQDSTTTFEQSISATTWSSIEAESQAYSKTVSAIRETADDDVEVKFDFDIYHTNSDKQKQVDEKEEISSYTRVTLSDFSDEALDLFSALDIDGNGFLSTSELAESVEQRFCGREAQVIAGLYVARAQLSYLSNDEFGIEDDGITRGDLSAFAHLESSESERDRSDVSLSVEYGLSNTYRVQQSGAEHLYIDPLNAVNSITVESINQGMIGDCYLLSTFAAIACTQPELIEQMIRDKGDGSYIVTFPGDPDNPITIEAPTETELGIYNNPGSSGIWASVLEKAYGKYCRENFFHRSILNLDGGNTTSEGAGGGELLHGKVLNFLTGRETDTDFIMFSNSDSIRVKLIEAFSKGRAVTTGVANNYFNDRSVGGFRVAHNYAILGFDADGEGGGTITVFDPIRGADRVVKLSLDDFMDNFSTITFSNG